MIITHLKCAHTTCTPLLFKYMQLCSHSVTVDTNVGYNVIVNGYASHRWFFLTAVNVKTVVVDGLKDNVKWGWVLTV